MIRVKQEPVGWGSRSTGAGARRARVITLAEEMLGEHQAVLLALLGAVASVALLAFANIATLIALRALAREGELAVRKALGASRLDLARLQALEAFTLVLAGSLLGIGLARRALGAVLALVPVTLPARTRRRSTSAWRSRHSRQPRSPPPRASPSLSWPAGAPSPRSRCGPAPGPVLCPGVSARGEPLPFSR